MEKVVSYEMSKDPRWKNLLGETYGFVEVIEFLRMERVGKNSYSYWKAKCQCGNEFEVRGSALTTGNTKSCGCHQVKRATEANHKHGLATRRKGYHPLYQRHSVMMRRCYNPDCPEYQWYGGKGVKVAEELQDVENYCLLLEKKLGLPNGLEVDRIDPDGDYTLENLQYATSSEQKLNTGRSHGHCITGRETKTYRTYRTVIKKEGGRETWPTFQDFLNDKGSKPEGARFVRENPKQPFSQTNGNWK